MHELSQITLPELSSFFGSLAALIGILWTIGMFCFRRWFSRLGIAVNATVLRILKKQIEGQISGLDPESYYTHDIHFTNGISLAAPMIPNVEITIAENLTISVTNHNCECTTLALKSTGSAYLPPHFHRHASELIEIRSGSITHMETGRTYNAGEVWFIPVDVPHSAVFAPDTFALISCRPPLLTAKERPVNLDQMEEAFSKPHKVYATD